MPVCSVGKFEDSSGAAVTCSGSLIDRSQLNEAEIRLIKIRSGCKKKKKTVCEGHHKKYVTSYESHHKNCSNPFKIHREKKVGKCKGSHIITLNDYENGKNLEMLLIPGQRLCAKCNIMFLNKQTESNIETGAALLSSPSIGSSQQIVQDSPLLMKESPVYLPDVNLSRFHKLNEWFTENGDQPVDAKKFKKQKNYSTEQLDKVKRILDTCADQSSKEAAETGEVTEWCNKADSLDEVLKQLQDEFAGCENRSDKVKIMSVLPKSWSVNKVQLHFSAPTSMIKKAKEITARKGIMPSPDKKKGKALEERTLKLAREFHFRQDISKELAGKNNVVSVKGSDGKRTVKRKHLVLANISHIYDQFKKKYPDLKISLSKFASLRPRECVLASSSGMHNVCVCTIHENPSLMFSGSHLKTISEFKKVSDCLNMLLCPEPTTSCHLRTCQDCPDATDLRERLELAFDEEMVDSITFNQWTTADRGNIVTVTSSVEEFTEEFISKLEVLFTHRFIFKSQTDYLDALKTDLKEGEAIFLADFAGNYSFVVQNSAQAYYFNTKQATIHPFTVYYKKPGEPDELNTLWQ